MNLTGSRKLVGLNGEIQINGGCLPIYSKTNGVEVDVKAIGAGVKGGRWWKHSRPNIGTFHN